jgi:ketosteroid isomerase-like protein
MLFMKSITALFLLTLTFSGAVAFSQESPVEAVQKLERAWLDAYEQLDAKAMDAIVAGDFTITFPNGGVQTKPQIIASLKSPRPAGRSMKLRTEEVQPRGYGDVVILVGIVVTEYQRDGKTVSENRQRYTDTYVKRNGHWQVVASHLSNANSGQTP